ncbi:MAG: rod shape-determining protein MreD [Bacillota bacterium]
MTRKEGLAAFASLFLAISLKSVEFVVFPVKYRPDLLVVLAASLGWASGLWMSFPLGFVLGLLEDLIFGRALGQRAISLAVASMTASLLRRFVNPDSALSKALVAVISAVLADAAGFATLRAMGIEIGLQYSVRMILPATAAWSLILILPIDALQRRLAGLIGRIVPAGEDREKEVAA